MQATLRNGDFLLRHFPALKMYLENPVVVRDIRAQMRGARSYWFIGIYLLLLGMLAIAGYAQATGQNLNPAQWSGGQRNIVDAQASLEGFYNFVFMTLAILITLIAPALTAASVVGERQRQSFDLLVTTPLTAGHILVGKLVSSIAFLGLLLLLSLPASALCILLGGATLGDVFRIYLLLAVDGIVLSAIGLYFSCAVRVPMLATVWTYVSVLGYILVTGYVSLFSFATNGGTNFAVKPALILAWFSPLMVIQPLTNNEGSGPFVWLYMMAFLGLAAFIVRLLLNAATYRLGLFGLQSGIALRRQALLLVGVLTGLVSYASLNLLTLPQEASSFNWLTLFAQLSWMVFIVALPFLPGLFVPATADDAPPGSVAVNADDPARHRLFVARRLFNPEHAGAFPWYIAFVATVTLGLLAGVISHPELLRQTLPTMFFGDYYLLTLGLLLWALSRFASSLVKDLSSARATAFALFVAVAGLPVLLLALNNAEWKSNPLVSLWLLSPSLYSGNHLAVMEAMLRSGTVALAVGTLVFLFDLALRQAKAPALATAKAR